MVSCSSYENKSTAIAEFKSWRLLFVRKLWDDPKEEFRVVFLRPELSKISLFSHSLLALSSPEACRRIHEGKYLQIHT